MKTDACFPVRSDNVRGTGIASKYCYVYNRRVAATVLVKTIHLRPLNVRTDLSAVADLIEMCFAHQMDSEGREYIRQLRRAADEVQRLRWLSAASEHSSIPLQGYIWEEEGRVVGNLTLIPFYWNRKWYYLIANVAVHPDFRQRGIARQLTERALEHIRERGIDAGWLQVRDDNPIAHNLYLSLGFVERARRSTWESTDPIPQNSRAQPNIQITPRIERDWPLQSAWLQANYPPEVAWNLPFDYKRLGPDLWRTILRVINGEDIYHWCARQSGELLGIVSWEPSHLHVDALWIATTSKWENAALNTLLPHVRHTIHTGRSLVVNYPYGQAIGPFLDSGFRLHNTLIWMEKRFKPAN
jgi:ribosomal protein S18 acetylase RimI-like enzyme